MRALGLGLAIALMLAATPAEAARMSPTPAPSGGVLPIQRVTVQVQPLEAAPGMAGTLPDGAHVEQPPLLRFFRSLPLAGQGETRVRGFKAGPPRPKASPSAGPANQAL